MENVNAPGRRPRLYQLLGIVAILLTFGVPTIIQLVT